MFSFESKGFFKPRKVIRNEYGIKLGKVEEIKTGSAKGYVELNEKKYFFEYDQDNTGELVLYDESMKKSLLTCSFDAIHSGLTKTKSLLDTRFASLLLVLCWYAFQTHNTAVSDVAA